jgi:PKD repeat protein
MDRRAFLTTTTGAAVSVGIAGCLGGDSDEDNPNNSPDGPGNDSDSPNGDSDGNPGTPDNDSNGSPGDTPGSTPEELEAAFSWQPSEPDVRKSVVFDASESTGDIVEYRWDFGDDGTANAVGDRQTVTHRFEEVGNKPVTLEVESSDGETATSTEEVSVEGVDAAFTFGIVIAEREASFLATASAGNIVEYRWDFDDDGTFETVTSDPSATHVFEDAGPATVTLEVEGSEGQTDSASGEIPVREAAPFVDATFDWEPTEPAVGEEATFDASEAAGDIVEYRWDFTGDGSFDVTTDESTVTYAFEEPGEVTVALEVEDSDGETDTASIEVPVREERPPSPEATFDWDPPAIIAGDEITFIAANTTGDIAEFRWDFDDDGSFEVITSQTTATHTFDDDTNTVVTLEVEDVRGRTDTVSREIRIGERPGPRAALDSTPSNPDPGEETTLDASASTDDIIEYRWDFDGDGTVDETTEAPTTTYVFEDPGLATVTLEVEGPDGETDTTSLDVPVGETAELNPAFESEPPEPAVDEEVTFDATESSGNIVEYRWDFDGDGSFETATDIPEATHVFEESGTVTVTLELQSEGGKTAQTTREIPVSG